MESISIPILMNFPLISVLMPYFGFTHQIFILLSSLSVGTRSKLIERYSEFRKFMLKYSKVKEVEIKDLLKRKFPLDIFILQIKTFTFIKTKAKDLKAFADMLINKEGCHLDSHYLSKQICMSRIYVEAKDIKDFNFHFEFLKSISVIPFENHKIEQDLSFTLLDLIVISKIFSTDNGRLKICFFDDYKCKDQNTIFQDFKKVEKEELKNYEDALIKLNMLKQSNIDEIEKLTFCWEDTQELERATNPQNFNYNILSLCFEYMDGDLLSDLILDNISKINPKKLYLSCFGSISDAIRFFTILPSSITINLKSRLYNKLTFRNTKVIFKDNDDNVELFCEEIRFGIGYRQNKNSIIFHKNNIIITDFADIGGDNMRRQITSTSVNNDISLDEINSESCVPIPKNSIDNLELDWELILKLLENDINKKKFSTLPSNSNVCIRLRSMNDVLSFYEACEFVPEHSKLELCCDFYYGKSEEENSLIRNALLNIASKFSITKINLKKIEKFAEVIILLLKESLIHNSLENFCITDCDSSDCLTILSLLSECMHIKDISISCNTVDVNNKYKGLIEDAKSNIKHSCKKIIYLFVNFR